MYMPNFAKYFNFYAISGIFVSHKHCLTAAQTSNSCVVLSIGAYTDSLSSSIAPSLLLFVSISSPHIHR